MLPYRKEFQVAAQDVDVTRHQALPAFGSCLLNTAGQAADQLGVGLEHLYRRGLAWVLSRLHLEMERLPMVDEKIVWLRGAISVLCRPMDRSLRKPPRCGRSSISKHAVRSICCSRSI